jgi:hypothetical protein
MRDVLTGAAALLLPVLLLAGPAEGAPKKNKDLDKDKTSEKMIRAGQLVGKVAAVNESKKSIRLSVTIAYTKLNQGAYNALVQAQLNLANARARGDKAGVASAYVEIVRQQNNLYTVETKSHDYELATVEDAVVRTLRPRELLDEKGKTRKPTREELKELKGDPKLPGYKAEFSDLAQEQVIRVHLVRKKGAPPKPVRKGRGKDKEDLDVMNDYLPQISMIVILHDVPAGK